MQDYYIDPHSQAWVFTPDSGKQALEENTELKVKLDKQQQLLLALINALPKTTKDKLPADLLEVLNEPETP